MVNMAVDPHKKRKNTHELEYSIDWNNANTKIPGIERLLKGSLSNITTASGQLYDAQVAGFAYTTIECDDECWIEWDGWAFDFTWETTTRKFVIRKEGRGTGDCVLESSSMIGRPILSWFVGSDEVPWEGIPAQEWANDHPSSVWKLASYVVDNCLVP